MSLAIAKLHLENPKKRNRNQLLDLIPPPEYNDGRTKQSFKDETDINAIMARFAITGTISHLAKYEGVYGDFSDFDFHEHTNKLTRGREVFDALPAEVRREFGQDPQAFFAYVNDPANKDKLRENLPALAEPGQQLPKGPIETADEEAALAAASEPASETNKTPPAPPETPPAG